MRSRVPHLAAGVHGVARPRDRQPPRGEEAATLPTLRSQPVAVNPAPIAAQPPPFLALLCLKSPIQRLELLIVRATVGLPRLNSLQNDRRGEITQGSNRPLLPARRSVREEVVVPSANRKRKRKPKQSRALKHVRKGTLAHSQLPSFTIINFARDFAQCL
ncbi:hypothetical protein BHE74_00025042 [Ensete ventricosum]|nr:hypothetical protein BHE74_00025042 [Ensete ventricosum]RZR82667.1 hypothetical protein BHM03_00009128 [Ensete ventricosum]